MGFTSCKKLVQIPPPPSTITTSQVFADSADANAAILGIYNAIVNTTTATYFGNGALSIYCGLSSDELINFQSDPNINQFYRNSIQKDNTYVYSYFWIPAYQVIYQTNASIEGLQKSTGINSDTKNQLISEAKFIRALYYFYLVNLFGDVPYITSSSWQQTSLASRTDKVQIFNQLESDLKEAQSLLKTDYLISNGERTRANQFTVTALLAKIYLYLQVWDKAEAEASAVINNTSVFSLNPDLNSVFSKNNSEAILQWQLNTNVFPNNATAEGYAFIPSDSTSYPNYYLNNQLINSFEIGDKRRLFWIDSTNYSGTIYYYPYKYKIGYSKILANSNATEYTMVLRLAEQYLIRAEARAQQGKLLSAIDDINIVRARAGLPNLTSSLTHDQVLGAILQERKIEFFAEGGQRWLDLKRTGKIDSVMSLVTPLKSPGNIWNTNQQLYPIPFSELLVNPNLRQNIGY